MNNVRANQRKIGGGLVRNFTEPESFGIKDNALINNKDTHMKKTDNAFDSFKRDKKIFKSRRKIISKNNFQFDTLQKFFLPLTKSTGIQVSEGKNKIGLLKSITFPKIKYIHN